MSTIIAFGLGRHKSVARARSATRAPVTSDCRVRSSRVWATWCAAGPGRRPGSGGRFVPRAAPTAGEGRARNETTQENSIN